MYQPAWQAVGAAAVAEDDPPVHGGDLVAAVGVDGVLYSRHREADSGGRWMDGVHGGHPSDGVVGSRGGQAKVGRW